MPVHFIEHEDIHLDNAPLSEVICQIRFPPLLRLINQQPAEFQEHVREKFPKISIEQPVIVGPLDKFGTAPQAHISPKVFHFANKTNTCAVSLAPDFLALRSTSYSTWATFSEQLRFAFEALQAVYDVPYATRIGLRYINLLTLANTGRESFEELTSLVRPELVALFQLDEITEPYLVKQELRTHIENDGDFTIRVSLVEAEENALLLDFDRYTEDEEILLDDLIERCDRYHRLVYNAFRWAIADNLHVFGPVVN